MLTVDSILRDRVRRARANHETYRTMYAAAATHVQRVSAALPKCTETLVQVPAFVTGRPPFDHTHAIRYVSDKLRRGGFSVEEDARFKAGTLRVSWAAGANPARSREVLRKEVRRKK